jgi:5-methylthioadenosine/S-adenosylhomocysteine deaminase
MTTLRIENALLLASAGVEPVPDAVLQAEEGVITYAGPAAGAPPCPLGAEVLDAGGKLLLPGLVNAHTHVAMTLFRGVADDMPLKPWLEEKIWPMEGRLTSEDVYWGALLGCAEMLRAGVTCFNDMYHHFPEGTRAAVDSGIRALPSGVLLGFLRRGDAVVDEAVEFCLGVREAHPRRVHPMLGPHAPYTCPDDLLRKVIAAAHEHDLGIHIHLAETAHEVEESLQTHGTTPLRHMADLGMFACRVTAAHCVWLGDDDIALAAETGVGCVHCPSSNMKLASGFARLPEMLAAGVTVGLGTDGAASNNRLDLLEEARLAALIHKGHSGDPTVVNAHQALHLATLGGARALGLGDLIGSLEAGKRADCILVDLSRAHNQPLFDVVSQMIYAARSSDVDTVIVEGAVLVQGGQFTKLDEAGIVAETTTRARRLARG